MAVDSNRAAAIGFTRCVERYYAALIRAADAVAGEDGELSLGGKLLYAGEMEQDGRALVVAGNVAGAASLSVTADAVAQKQAVRDGVVDFLVTSLDEALRILKNEIRKREPVAACVAGSVTAIEREMVERGVQPDLLRAGTSSTAERLRFLSLGARRIEATPGDRSLVLLTWSVSAAPAAWLPKLDDLALDCLPHSEWTGRRWLRLAPRYLGRLAQGVRLLSCGADFASEFRRRVQMGVDRGEIGVEVRMEASGGEDDFLDTSEAKD